MNEEITLNKNSSFYLNENNKKKNYIQVLRGIAILGVVLIHAISNIENNNINVILRQFINYSVPLFLFISGYLITSEKFNNKDYIKSFYKKRFLRIGIPYLVFSLIAFILNDDLRHISLSKKIFYLLIGQANSIYYYIIVYLQLIVLTPILVKLINKINPIFIYSLSFLTILFEYCLILLNKPLPFPYNVLSFTTWILFYYMGIVMKNTKSININIKNTIILTISMLILSIVEGFIWFKFFNNISIAVSQTKITSFLFSYFFIRILMYYKDSLNNRILKFIGDNSFGIYLIHTFIMERFIKLFPYYNDIINLLVTAVVSLLISLLIIIIVKKVFGKKYASIIFGF